jgi:hypothetical protein
MTFEKIFSGRMMLMRVQRHISQAEWDGKSSGLNPRFKTRSGEEAFFIVERLLIDLEKEFDRKAIVCHRRKRQSVERRADRQVTAR